MGTGTGADSQAGRQAGRQAGGQAGSQVGSQVGSQAFKPDWTINGRGDYERAQGKAMAPARATTETSDGGYGFINSRISDRGHITTPVSSAIRRVLDEQKWYLDCTGKPQLKHGRDEAWNVLGPENVNGTTQVTVQVGPQDTKITTCHRHGQSRTKGGKRGNITQFSDDSRRRMLESMRNTPAPLEIMGTLTYPGEFPTDGEIVKNHLSRMRKWLARNQIAAFWFLEFQARGAPHFHFLCPDCHVPYHKLAKAWYKIVGSGDPRHLQAGTRIERLRKPHAAQAYAAKYAGKMAQKEVPEGYRNVGRFWGCFGKVRPVWQYFTGKEWQMYAVVRLVRKAREAVIRNNPFKSKPLKLNGRYGFTAYGVGDYIVRGIEACLGT